MLFKKIDLETIMVRMLVASIPLIVVGQITDIRWVSLLGVIALVPLGIACLGALIGQILAFWD